MTKRTDIHRPSVIQPEDYDFVAIISHQDETGQFNLIERKNLQRHMGLSGGKFSTHAHGGSCHICGAGAMTLAYFHHVPSNQYIVTGQDCCEKISEGHADRFRAIRDEANALENAKAGKMKARGILKGLDLEECMDIYENGYDAYDRSQPHQHGIIFDIVDRLVKYGNISEKQEQFLAKLLKQVGQDAARKKMWAEQSEKAAPVQVSDKRMTIEGEILTLKMQESDYGDTLKMLVQHADGWKVWGSVPSAMNTWDYENDCDGLKKGDKVRFDAKVEPSKDDKKFGFFSRPTKAVIVSEEA